MVDIATLSYVVTTTGLAAGTAALNAHQAAASRAAAAATAFAAAMRGVATTMAAFAGGAGIIGMIRMVDSWSLMQGKLLAAGVELGRVRGVQAQLVDLAVRSRAEMSTVVTLYQRITQATETWGTNQAAVLRSTETLTKALRLGGATINETNSIVSQFTQGLAVGRFNGDELKSVLENSLILGRAIADEFGVGVGQLRDMGAEGKLVADRVLRGVLEASEEIDERFKLIPMTIGDAFLELRNRFREYVGQANDAHNATRPIVDALKFAADHIDHLVAGMTALAAIIGTIVAMKFIGMLATLASGPWAALRVAVVTVNALVVAFNTLQGVVVKGSVTLEDYWSAFKRRIGEVVQSMRGVVGDRAWTAIGDTVRAIWESIPEFGFIAIDAISGTLVGLGTAIADAMDEAGTAIMELFGNIANFIITTIGGAINGVVSMVNFLIGRINAIKLQTTMSEIRQDQDAFFAWKQLNPEPDRTFAEWEQIELRARGGGNLLPTLNPVDVETTKTRFVEAAEELGDAAGDGFMEGWNIGSRLTEAARTEFRESMSAFTTAAERESMLRTNRWIWNRPRLAGDEANLEDPFLGAPPGVGAEEEANAYSTLVKNIREKIMAMEAEVVTMRQTAGVTAEYTTRVELLAAAQEAGIQVTAAVARQIDALAESYGALTDKVARAKLETELLFETEQLFRSEADQQIAARLHGAGLEVDLEGYHAGLIRSNQLLEQQVEAWKEVQDVGKSAIDNIVDSAVEGFRDFEDVLKKIASDLTKHLLELAVSNPIKNALYGSGLPTLDSIGGLKGFFGALFGGESPAADSAVGAMTVTAGTVVIHGGVVTGSGLGTTAADFAAQSGPVIGNLGGGAGWAMGGSTQAAVWNFFSSKGLSPVQIAGIMGNIQAESSFNPSARNPNGGAYGLFQHLGSRLNALGRGADLNRQLEFAWQELQGPESRVLEQLRAATTVRESTAAFAGFERAEGWSRANPEGIILWDQRLAAANQHLTQFGTTVNAATMDLSGFGSGLGKMGQALSQVPTTISAAAGGGGSGGGVLGFLGQLFGGLGGAGTNPAAATGSTWIWRGGVPRFAEGGVVPYMTLGMVGEAGPEAILPLRRDSQGRLGVGAGGGGNVIRLERHIHNNAPDVRVREEQTDDGQGGIREDIYIERAVAGAITRPGSDARRALGAMGARPPLRRR